MRSLKIIFCLVLIINLTHGQKSEKEYVRIDNDGSRDYIQFKNDSILIRTFDAPFSSGCSWANGGVKVYNDRTEKVDYGELKYYKKNDTLYIINLEQNKVESFEVKKRILVNHLSKQLYFPKDEYDHNIKYFSISGRQFNLYRKSHDQSIMINKKNAKKLVTADKFSERKIIRGYDSYVRFGYKYINGLLLIE